MRASLRSLLPPEASVANPVDMIAGATARQYGEVVRAIGATSDVDAQIVVFNTPVLATSSEVASELVAARRHLPPEMPLVAVFLNGDGPPELLRQAGVPAFTFPENAARALGRGVAWHQKPPSSPDGQLPGGAGRPPARRRDVELLLAAARLKAADGWLTTADAEALVRAYGIAVPRSIVVRAPAEAGAAQAELGGVVVVKLAAAVHKSDMGGVRLGLTTPAESAAALLSVRAAVSAAGRPELAEQIVVQEQVGGGLEMIVGTNRDPTVGPLVVVGLGGRLVEVLADVAIGVAPLLDDDVADMVRSLKSYHLLTGHRGTPALDVEALCQVVTAVSAIVDEFPEVVEMDINPLFVHQKGAVAADVRVRVICA